MPRQAERTKPTTFDSFTDVRISVIQSESRGINNLIFNDTDDLDDETKDRLGLLRQENKDDDESSNTNKNQPLAAGGGMRQGKPFSKLSINSSIISLSSL